MRVAKETPMETTTPYVIVPMAGFGRRFLDAGYTDDKPLIEVGGRTLLDWSLSCLPEAWAKGPWVRYVIRSGQIQLQDRLAQTGDVTVIPGATQGAACTVLAAAVGLNPGNPVMIMNADQVFQADVEEAHRTAMNENYDGFILTFEGKGPAWSYVVTNGTDRVVHVIEKKEVSPLATVGVYWWRRAGDLVRAICKMVAVEHKTKGEFFMAPAYNFLSLSDRDVRVVPVLNFHGLGTPEDVEAFREYLASHEGMWP